MGKVYLLRSGDFFKIGYTKNDVSKRIKQLQTGNPDVIEFINVYESDNARNIESALHNLLSHKRTTGEYFDLSSDDILNFNSLCEKIDSNIELIKKPRH